MCVESMTYLLFADAIQMHIISRSSVTIYYTVY